jgi:hypothetical protein
MRLKTILLTALPLTLLAMLATGWLARADAVRRDAPAPGPGRAIAVASAPAAPAGPSDTAPMPGRSQAPALPADLAARVDAWAQSPDPADAMRAYIAVFDCLEARRDAHRPTEEVVDERRRIEQALPLAQRERARRQWQTSAAHCGNLRSDQVQRRMQWLARAAQAGEPRAAIQFIDEGPDGDGALMDAGAPRPALTDAWRAQRDAYVDAAFQRCDTGLVGYLGLVAPHDGRDVAQALTVWQSHLRCDGSPAPPPLRDDAMAMKWLHDVGAPGVHRQSRFAG